MPSLYAPNGTMIVGTKETIPGVANITNIDVDDNGDEWLERELELR